MTATLPDPFFSRSEMGEIMRSHNWELTPLGAVEQWSVQLKTILNLILNAGHPMFILWGDEQLLLYNNAYHSIWKNIQPNSTLGQPFKSCLPEIYQEVRSDLEKTLASKEAICQDHQKFNQNLCNDCYFKTSYSPIFDQMGQVTGVWGTMIETSSPQISQETTNKILERITDAFVALDRNWRYTYVNQEAARLLGYSREELLGKQLWKDVFAGELQHDNAQKIRQAMREQTPLHLEAFSPIINRYLEINAYPSQEGISIYFRDISKRKKIEAQLRSSEEFNRRIIESSVDCIKVLDLEGRLLSMNSGGKLLLEINDIQPFLHQSWVEFWQGTDRAQAQKAITQARVGSSSRFQGYCPTQTGQPKWWDVILTPIFAEQGQVEQILCLSRDITFQRQAELALRRGEERFRALIEQAPDAVFIADLDGSYIDVNNNACDLLGYQREELIGKHIKDFVQPEDQHRLEAMKQSLLLGKTQVEEWTLMRKDRTTVPVEISTKILPDGRWQAFVRNISDRIRTQEALRQSEERFRQMAENIEDVFWVVEMQNYKVLYVSPAYENLWGRSCESLYENPYQWMEAIHPDDRQTVQAAFTEQVLTGRCDLEFRIIRPDGSIGWIRDRGFPIPDEDGQIRRVAGIAEDITDRKQAEAALKQQEKELRLITDAVPALIAYIDRHRRYRFVNSAYTDWFGHPPEKIIGQHLVEFVGEAAYQYMHPNVESALAGEPVMAELWMPFKDGGPRYVRRQYIPDIASDGTVKGFYALITDITNLKQAEVALRQSEQRYRSLVSILSSIVWTVDPEGQFIEPQPAWEIYTGQSWSEHQNWGWLEAIHPEDREGVRALWIEARDNKTIYQSEGRIWNSATGNYRYFEAKGIPLFNSEGSIEEWVGTITDVDNRKRSEVALRQSEQRFRQMAENVEDVFWIMDVEQLQILYVSPAYERIWGCSAENLYTNPYAWLEPVHREDYERVRIAFFEQGFEGQFSQEYRIIRPDGSVRWIRDRSFPIPNEQGEIQRVAGIAEDITTSKEVEAALRRSEQQFRVAQDLSLYAFTILKSVRDETGQIIDFDCIYVNPTAEVALKRSAENIIGQRLLQILPGSQLNANLFNRYVEVVETGQSHNIEILYDADGITGWFHNMAVKLEDGVAISFSEISDRKQAEAALRRSEAAARARAEELEALMEVVPAAIWIAQDRHCYQMSANLSAYELMRMSPGEITTATPIDGKNRLPFKQQKNGKNIPPHELPMQTAGRTGEEVEGELEFVFDSGEISYIYGKAVPLRDDNGQVRGVIGAFLDVTERKQAEAEREQLLASERAAREEAEAANRIKDEFLAVLSHELRSPLNPILGWANLLQRQQVDDKILHQGLTTIERNVKLQVQLIDDLLDVSRILRGKLSLNRGSVDLVVVVISAIETVRLAAQAKSIEIQTHLDTQVGRVLGDSGRLQQIVWNLLSNAVKFSDSGGKVDVYLEQAGSQAQIRVQDQGKGINPKFLPYVFDYFRQEDGTTTRKFGGLGLGLAIVRYITEMHGGTVKADSLGVGQGATFTVNLPLFFPDSESSENDNPINAESVNVECLQGVKVLIVEDELDTRECLSMMLEQAGATVTAKSSAQEGLKEFIYSTPDILVSDIGMPGMDGYQLIKQVRSLYKNNSDKQMPAIALTAYAGETDFEKAISAGFNLHISKPVEPQRLIKAILNLLNK